MQSFMRKQGPMTFTAFMPVLVGNKVINLRQNKSFWVPEVTQYVFFWSSNVSQTACVRMPTTTPTPASGPSTTARTCSTASLQTARYSPVSEGWRRVVLFETRSSPLLPPPPPVICRNVRPEIGPPPAGEHREESGSVRPAGDEPAAHKAPVLPGQKLPRHPVRRFVRAA